jgi:hypothetical protein
MSAAGTDLPATLVASYGANLPHAYLDIESGVAPAIKCYGRAGDRGRAKYASSASRLLWSVMVAAAIAAGQTRQLDKAELTKARVP